MKLKFWKSKKDVIQELLERYRGYVGDCVVQMSKTVECFCAEADRKELAANIDAVSEYEGKADDLRREIQVLLYSKSLFPESRGDLLGLLESTDKVANRAEAIALMLKTHRITIPPEIVGDICSLAQIASRCVAALLKCESLLFSNFHGALEILGKVNELESEADFAEQRLTEKVFALDLRDMEKLLLRDFIARLSSVCDSAENVADRIRIIIAKRGV